MARSASNARVAAAAASSLRPRRYLDILRSLGKSATITQVHDALTPTSAEPISRGAVQLRLDRLVEEGQVERERETTGRLQYRYEPKTPGSAPDAASATMGIHATDQGPPVPTDASSATRSA